MTLKSEPVKSVETLVEEQLQELMMTAMISKWRYQQSQHCSESAKNCYQRAIRNHVEKQLKSSILRRLSHESNYINRMSLQSQLKVVYSLIQSKTNIERNRVPTHGIKTFGLVDGSPKKIFILVSPNNLNIRSVDAYRCRRGYLRRIDVDLNDVEQCIEVLSNLNLLKPLQINDMIRSRFTEHPTGSVAVINTFLNHLKKGTPSVYGLACRLFPKLDYNTKKSSKLILTT